MREIRTWRIIGNPAEMTLEEARCHARSVLASLHNGEEIIAATNEETRFEVVAEKLFEACERHWKAQHQKGQPFLSQEPDPALVPEHAGRRDHRAETSSNGTPRFMRLPSPPTALHPCSAFSSGRPRFMAIARRVPTPVSVSGDIEGADASAFSRRKKCNGSAPY